MLMVSCVALLKKYFVPLLGSFSMIGKVEYDTLLPAVNVLFFKKVGRIVLFKLATACTCTCKFHRLAVFIALSLCS